MARPCLAVFACALSAVVAQLQQPLGHFEISSSSSNGVNLHIWTRNGTRNDTAPYLSGLIFEDISHSGDGGIYAELVNNRAFQGSGVTIGSAEPLLPGMMVLRYEALGGQTILSSENPTIPFAPTIDHWYAVGDARISLDYLHPLSDALQVSLQVDIPLNASGEVGIRNDGFWGMQVSPQTYNASFYVQTNSFRWNYTLTHFNVSLRDDASGDVFVSSTISVNSSTRPVPYMYSNYSTQLINTETAPTVQNSLYITMDGDELRGQTLYFDLVSLFPETYKNRPNGLRKDLAAHLEAANYRFLRFPGGNNLEGYSIARRWKWWETIGPLINRPGRPGDWSYFNTDGLGLLEFMYWCEDMSLVPLLGIYAGFSLDLAAFDIANSTDTNELPLALMRPILQEALDELEYLTGNTSTRWGEQRAAHGHPEPFQVPFVEIGNEDFFSHSYPARAAFMLEGLRAVYPDITYVYSAANLAPQDLGNFNITLPHGTVWDNHVYSTPEWFINHFDQWDNWQRDSNLANISESEEVYASLMEYHVNSPVSHPTMLSAVAEAVHALGWERNPNTFKLAAFAPAIQNVNFYRHTPYLILLGADGEEDLLSVSYYQQQMFNLYHGTQTLPVTTDDDSDYNPLFWAAQIDKPKNAIYLKIVNAGDSPQALDLTLDVPFRHVNGTILERPTLGDAHAFNYFDDKTAIVPRAIDGLQGSGPQGEGRKVKDELAPALFNWTVPAYSISVLQFDLDEA